MGTPKVGRNDPCPCGSGKKYKSCCVGKFEPQPRLILPIHNSPRNSVKPAQPPVEVPKVSAWIWNVFSGDQKASAALKLIEDKAASFAKNYCVGTELPDDKFLSNETDLIYRLGLHLASFQMSYGRRLATLYCDALESINRRRLHLSSLAMRSYLEHTGAVIYFGQKLKKRLVEGIKTQAQLDKVINLLRLALRGGRFEWTAYAMGGEAWDKLIESYAKAENQKQEPLPEIRQESCAEFIAAFEERLTKEFPQHQGKVRAIYAMLSDICHPSFGGDLFFVEVHPKAGLVRQRAEPQDEVMRNFIRRIALTVLRDFSEITIAALNDINGLADSLEQHNKDGKIRKIPSKLIFPIQLK